VGSLILSLTRDTELGRNAIIIAHPL